MFTFFPQLLLRLLSVWCTKPCPYNGSQCKIVRSPQSGSLILTSFDWAPLRCISVWTNITIHTAQHSWNCLFKVVFFVLYTAAFQMTTRRLGRAIIYKWEYGLNFSLQTFLQTTDVFDSFSCFVEKAAICFIERHCAKACLLFSYFLASWTAVTITLQLPA